MKKLTAIFLFAGLVLFLPAMHAQQTYVGGQVGIGIPGGEFGKSYGLGYGGSAQFLYNLVEENIWVNGHIGYTRFGYSSDSRTDRTGSWSTVPLLGSLRYQLSKGNFRFYIGAQAGLHFVSRTIETKKNEVDITTQSGTETAFGAGLLGGFFYPISKSLTLDATLSYNTLLTEELEDNPGFLTLMIGIIYPITL
ncbi:MAG: hypothetical protein HY962_02750 [Ignavibacteriae bacterium]|nr:hypothetical protein [Ignavibacteriota bacterium]